jgi:hypothetical protein
MSPCSFYPKDEPICGAGSEVSGYVCTEEDELQCPWARQMKGKEK